MICFTVLCGITVVTSFFLKTEEKPKATYADSIANDEIIGVNSK